MIGKPRITTALGAGHRPHPRVAQTRSLVLVALTFWASVTDGKSATAGFGGVVSLADGEPFTIVRRDTLMSGSRGVALLAGDIVETGPKAFLVIQGPGGNLIGIGPATGVYFVERAEVMTVFVLKGWVKADVKSGPMRLVGTRLGLQSQQAVTLLYADEQSNAVFAEQGAATILLPDASGKSVDKDAGPNHFFVREDQQEVLSRPSPSVEFVEKMPIAFRDPLPQYANPPQAVTPRVVRAVTYNDIQNWLTIPREWRGGFIGRFRGRLKDPAFFAAMDAHQSLFPEWVPILHPPPPAASATQNAEPEQGHESR